MPTEIQNAIHKHVHVYSSDQQDLGQVDHVYEDSFAFHKGLLAEKRYIPYEFVSSFNDDRVILSLTKDEANEPKWKRRPDYERHLGDPTQLFYDRGHGIHDPFDRTT